MSATFQGCGGRMGRRTPEQKVDRSVVRRRIEAARRRPLHLHTLLLGSEGEEGLLIRLRGVEELDDGVDGSVRGSTEMLVEGCRRRRVRFEDVLESLEDGRGGCGDGDDDGGNELGGADGRGECSREDESEEDEGREGGEHRAVRWRDVG